MGIDPGTTQTAYAVTDGRRLVKGGILPNGEFLALCRQPVLNGLLEASTAIVGLEMVASYGMAVGATVFETVLWAGRFHEALEAAGLPPRLVYRKEVKMNLCQSMRAKDGNIRVALMDRLGPPGTKKAPGPTYGARKDVWAALGVAVTLWDISHASEEFLEARSPSVA